jgi:hypothetical protein
MEKILTAEEFLKLNNIKPYPIDIQMMVEFAKMHVEAALKAKVNAMADISYDDSSYTVNELDSFTINSYPLENIK